METLELAVSPKYANHWELMDGLREIVANAIDESGRKKSEIQVTLKGHELMVYNKVGELEKQNFVMGGGDKEAGGSTIGQFGEGLKVGAMVIARNNRNVWGISGSMKFTFRVSFSDKWNSDILFIDIENKVFESGTKVF